MTVHLKQDEVAERLRISPRTLEGWRQNNNSPLPWLKIGGNVRYRLCDVEAYEEGQLRTAPEPLAPYAGKYPRY